MRDLFLLDPGIAFLNHGSFGACPKEVLEALWAWQREMERNPAEFLGRRSGTLLDEARAALASYLGADADDLAFVPNATTGVNTVARSLVASGRIGPGDEVLGTDHEYGACEAALERVCAEAGAAYRRVAIPLPFERGEFVGRLLDAVTPRTRLVFASHITSVTALTFPVAELCAAARRRGLPTLIDGAHAPGQIDLALNAIGADFYTGNGHKWMMAPKGSAFLHVRREHHGLIEAPVISWGYAAERAGHTGFDAYTGSTPLQRRLQWQGTRDITPWLALPAAIDFQSRHDWPAVRTRCHELARATLARFVERFGLPAIARDEDYAQMAALPVPHADAEALRARLWSESRIEVPVTQHGGRTFVRISVQGYTTPDEIARLWNAPALAGG